MVKLEFSRVREDWLAGRVAVPERELELVKEETEISLEVSGAAMINPELALA